MTDLATQKQEVYDYVYNMLGGGMVDVELDPIHYATALNKALTRFRQRSSNAVEESYLFLTLIENQNEYIMPKEVIEIRQLYRRSVGSKGVAGSSNSSGPVFSTSKIVTLTTNQTFEVGYNLASVTSVIVTVNGTARGDFTEDYGTRTITFTTPLNVGEVVNIKLYTETFTSGSEIEPFNAAFTNTYLLTGTSKVGGMATYELFAGYQELAGRMFGSFIEFKWNPPTKKLTILQKPRGTEEVLVWAYNYRPDDQLLNDYLSIQWIKDFTLASCKFMLGEARSKFATIAGPQGGSTLNGDALKAEAQAEMEKLEIEVMQQVAGGGGYSFLIG